MRHRQCKHFTKSLQNSLVGFRRGWAGHKLTDRRTIKGESGVQSLHNSTCPSEPDRLSRQSKELDDDEDAPKDLEEAGGKDEGLEEDIHEVKELDEDQERMNSLSMNLALLHVPTLRNE